MFDQISLELTPSFLVATLITAVCFSAGILMQSLDLSFGLNFLLLLCLLAINGYYLRLFGTLKSPSAITRIKLNQQTITLFDQRKNVYHAEFSNYSFVNPWFCILMFSSTANNSLTPVILCKHNLNNKNDFRRFRVWIKFGQATPKNKALFE